MPATGNGERTGCCRDGGVFGTGETEETGSNMIYLRTWELRQFVGFPTAEICPYLESYGGREWGATLVRRATYTDDRQRVFVFSDPVPSEWFTTTTAIM